MSKVDDVFKRIYDPTKPNVQDKLKRNNGASPTDASTTAKRVLNKESQPFNYKDDGSFSTQKPLTMDEAKVVNDRIDVLRAQIDRIRSKTEAVEKKILNQLEGNPDLPTFKMDISKRPKLRKATKVVFGFKADEISFTMYRQALEEKIALEKEDSDSMFEEDSDSSGQNITDLLKGVM
jgi:hypothetical protein